MFKHSSDALQDRTRRSAASAPTHGGLDASDAFRGPTEESAEEIEHGQVKERLIRVQSALRAINEKRSLVDIQRQIAGLGENKFQTRNHRQLRFELGDEARDLQLRLSQLKPIIKRQKIAAADKQHVEFGRAFMDVAKRMLAEPVYDRILTATLHYVGDRDGDRSGR